MPSVGTGTIAFAMHLVHCTLPAAVCAAFNVPGKHWDSALFTEESAQADLLHALGFAETGWGHSLPPLGFATSSSAFYFNHN